MVNDLQLEILRQLLNLDSDTLRVLYTASKGRKHLRHSVGHENTPPVIDLKSKTLANEDFRHTLTTGAHSQLVLMSLQPSEGIGMETHSDVDQLIYIVKGHGHCVLNGITYHIQSGYSISIKAGVEHDIVNDSAKKMKLFTIYSPPEHPPGTIQHSRSQN